eukprot:6212939-Pleurochrysis_carterae.AAC.1
MTGCPATDELQATYELACRRRWRAIAASCFCGIAMSEPDIAMLQRRPEVAARAALAAVRSAVQELE